MFPSALRIGKRGRGPEDGFLTSDQREDYIENDRKVGRGVGGRNQDFMDRDRVQSSPGTVGEKEKKNLTSRYARTVHGALFPEVGGH